MTENSLLQDFISEAGDHLKAANRNLLRFREAPADVSLLSEIFRSIHTIKGSSEYLGLERIAELSYKLEGLLDLLRRGEREARKDVIDLLISAGERLESLVAEVDQKQKEESQVDDLVFRIEELTCEIDPEAGPDESETVAAQEGLVEEIVFEDEHDEELFGIFLDQLKDGLQGLHGEVMRLEDARTAEPVLEQCLERLGTLRSSANYMGYEKLKDHYETWMRVVAEMREQLAGDDSVDVKQFAQEVMTANIERVQSFFPKVEDLLQIAGGATGQAQMQQAEAQATEAVDAMPVAEAQPEMDEQTDLDAGGQSLLADFITETGEHLDDTERNLLQLGQRPDDVVLMNEIFRAIHTIKGSSEYLGLVRIAELSHKLENLLDLLRRGERKASSDVIELLISANDRIGQLVDDLDREKHEATGIEDLIEQIDQFGGKPGLGEAGDLEPVVKAEEETVEEIIYEDEHDEELFGIFLDQLKEGLQGLHGEVMRLEDARTAEPVLEQCLERLGTLRSSANYMGYEKLKDHYETWMRVVAEMREQLAGDDSVDVKQFAQEVMTANIERVQSFFPKVEGLFQIAEAEAGQAQATLPEDEAEEEIEAVESMPVPEAPPETDEQTVLDSGVQSLLADFITETGEHLDDTERNLLRLEQRPDDIALMNEIFRAIHTIKGSSEYLGLVRIAELSHKLENLLDQLRRGERSASKDVIELLISANDRIGQLVDDLDQHQMERTEIGDLLKWIDGDVTPRDATQPLVEACDLDPVKFGHGPMVYEETYDQELFEIFLKHFNDGLRALREEAANLYNPQEAPEALARCEQLVERLRSSANYMDYAELKDFYDTWLLTIQETLVRLNEGGKVDLADFADRCVTGKVAYLESQFNGSPSPAGEPEAEASHEDLEVLEPIEEIEPEPVADVVAEQAQSDQKVEQPAEVIVCDEDDDDLIARLESAFDARLGISGHKRETRLPLDVEGELLSDLQQSYSDNDFVSTFHDASSRQDFADSEADTLETFLQQEQDGAGGDERFGDTGAEAEETSLMHLFAEPNHDVAPRLQSGALPLEGRAQDTAPAGRRRGMKVVEPEAAAPAPLTEEQRLRALSLLGRGDDRRRSQQLGRRKTDKFRERMMKQSIRVEAGKIDYLMNQVGELVVNRAGFAQIFNDMRELHFFLKQTQKLDKQEMQQVQNLTNRISDATLALGRVTAELQENVMKVRMLPIAQLFSRYPRLVHDLVRNTQKKVNLDVRGEDTELDKMVIEQIADPMIHIIRNAVDHGIEDANERQKRGKPETGTLKMEAYHEGNYVVIEISDDGRGIDLEKIKDTAVNKGFVSQEELEQMDSQQILALIMKPGFSTAEEVTHTSGRGVGMDVVKDHIEKLSGTIDIHSTPGSGTRIRIKIPLTLAIIPALMVTVADEIYTIPLAAVDETIRVHRQDVSTIEGLEVIYLRDATIPLIRLDEVFKTKAANAGDEFFVVVVNVGDRRVGFIVDQLRGREEVVIKPLEDYLQEKSGFSGATILGDGTISLILDVYELVSLSVDQHSNRARAAAV